MPIRRCLAAVALLLGVVAAHPAAAQAVQFPLAATFATDRAPATETVAAEVRPAPATAGRAPTIRVGMIDTGGARLAVNDPGVRLTYTAFDARALATGVAAAREASVGVRPALPHGVTVATLLTEAARAAAPHARIELFSADVFRPAGNGALVLDNAALDRAFEWLAGEGVTVVCLSFATADRPAIRDAFERARERGLVLVAAVPNQATSPLHWPAAYHGTIAVAAPATTPEGSVADLLPAFATRTVIRADGTAEIAVNGTLHRMKGNSFAAARVAGRAAAALHAAPGLSQQALTQRLADGAPGTPSPIQLP